MPVLKNAKHERFAQAVAIGKSQAEAYAIAGYEPSDQHASRLASSGKVRARIDEILAAAAEKAGVTVEKIITELAKIGFADIRKAVEWHGSLSREQDNPDGGDVLVIKEIFSNHVRLIDSDKLDEPTAAAISEVRQSPTGGLSIKLHDKQAALVNLGKHLGMFKERFEHTGPNGAPLVPEPKQTSEQVKRDLGEVFGAAIVAVIGGPIVDARADNPMVRQGPQRGRGKKRRASKAGKALAGPE